jgi:hypothetical protein
MPLIVRIDVDRPYGRQPLWRHALSRASSDLYFPAVAGLGYLRELGTVLRMLNDHQARAHVFFRRCTLPSPAIRELLQSGGHAMGMHLENSRSFDTFHREKQEIEQHLGQPITLLSKHGSGGRRYGRHHHAPYEPEKYEAWCAESGVRYFLGNLEDPRILPFCSRLGDVRVYPAAFWLEPAWRDDAQFPVQWLVDRAQDDDIVLLIHAENVLASDKLIRDLERLLSTLKTRILE